MALPSTIVGVKARCDRRIKSVSRLASRSLVLPPSETVNRQKSVPTRAFATATESSVATEAKGARIISEARLFMESFAKTNKITNLTDWYKITTKDLQEAKGGSSVLRSFKYSPIRILQNVFPEHFWDPLEFKKSPQRSLSYTENRRRLMDQIGAKLSVKTLDDWYKISREKVEENGGLSLLLKFKNSLHKTLQSIYPEHSFRPWLFQTAPHGFWTSRANRRQFLEVSKIELKVSAMEDWYGLQHSALKALGGTISLRGSARSKATNDASSFFYSLGGGLLGHFKGKVSSAIMDAFPEHEWEPWRFSRSPAGFWRSQQNRAKYFDWLSNKLSLTAKDQWYRVSVAAVRAHDGAGILQRYSDSLEIALKEAYPDHKWDTWKFQTVKAGAERAPDDEFRSQRIDLGGS